MTPFKLKDLTDDPFSKDALDSYMELKTREKNAQRTRDDLVRKYKQDAINYEGYTDLDKVRKEMDTNPFSKNRSKYQEFYDKFYKKPGPGTAPIK